MKKGCIIVNKSGRHIDGRIFKSCSKARRMVKNIIKNNSAQQRKQVGYVGLKIRSKSLYPRQVDEMKKVKDFIYN